MKKFHKLYSNIASIESLLYAWERFKVGKRKRKDVARFEWDLERNIFDLHSDLIGKAYQHGPYFSFVITDPKQRNIHKATVRDRVVHHAVFEALNSVFEPTFISTSFSCRMGKGTHKGVDAVARMARSVSKNYSGPCFALKCDVRKFFDSIDHGILLNMLSQRIADAETMQLLENIIESYISNQSNLFERRGLPIGNLTSQLFANVYMNVFDQFMKHELGVKNYARYTDDFIVLSDDENYLQGLLPVIETVLKDRLSLTLHPGKIQLVSLLQGIDFLGYIIRPHHQVTRTRTRRRMIRKLHKKIVKHENGELSADALKQTLASYLGVLSHASAHRLAESLKNETLLSIREY